MLQIYIAFEIGLILFYCFHPYIYIYIYYYICIQGKKGGDMRNMMDMQLDGGKQQWVQVTPKNVQDDDVYGRYNKMKSKLPMFVTRHASLCI